MEGKILQMAQTMQQAIEMSEGTVSNYIRSGNQVKEVIDNITEINTLSTQNSDSVKEMRSAAVHLSAMSETLNAKLTQFKT